MSETNKAMAVVVVDDQDRSATSAYLWVCSGENMGRRFELTKNEHLMGRSATVDIPIIDRRASQSHAQVVLRDHEHYIEDLGSTNGTFVNNELLSGHHQLQDGDLVQIGETVFEYIHRRDDGPAGPRSMTVAGSPGGAVAAGQAGPFGALQRQPPPAAAQPCKQGDVYGHPADWLEADHEEPEDNALLALILRIRAAVQFFLRRWKMITTLGLVAAAAGALSVSLETPLQTAEFEVVLYPPVRGTPLGPPQNAVRFFDRATRSFSSAELVKKTLALLGEDDPGLPRVQAIQSRLRLASQAPAQPNAYRGSFSDADGAFAHRFLTAHMDVFMEAEVSKTLRAMQETVELFKEQLQRADAELAALRKARREFEVKFKDVKPEQAARLLRLQERQSDLQASVAAAEQKQQLVRDEMRRVPKTIDKPAGVDPYRPFIAQKEKTLIELLESGLAPEHPKVKQIKAEIARLEKLSKGLASAGRTIPNPAHLKLAEQLRQYVFEEKVATTNLASVKARIRKLGPVVDRLAVRNERSQELSVLLEAAVQKRKAIYEGLSRAESQLAVERVSVDARYELSAARLVPFDPSKQVVKRSTLGLLAGLALGVLVAMYLQLRRDPTYAAALSLRGS